MKRNLLLLVAVLLLSECPAVFAQQFFVRNFSTSDYDAGTQNWQIAFGKDEMIFFANNDGLILYDGYKWEKKQVKNFTTVRSVYYSKKDQRIYVGASNEFGYFFLNPKTCQIEYCSLCDGMPVTERDFGEIWRIYSWNGKIVFQGHNAIYSYDGKKPVGLGFKNRIELSAVIGNHLVIADRQNLIITETNGQKRIVPLSNELRDNAIREILPYGNNMILATPGKGLFLFDGATFTHLDTPIDDLLNDAQIFSADIKGEALAIGTVRNGLFVYDLKSHSVKHANVEKGLRNNTILSLKIADDNSIWLGLDNGIAYIQQNYAYSQLIPYGQNIGTGYASLVDGTRLLLGTNQGLFAMAISSMGMPLGAVYPIPAIRGQVWSLCHCENDVLCSTDNGAFVVRGSSAEQIVGMEGTWTIVPLKHHPGYLLASDYKGLCILRKVGGRYVVQNRLADLQVTSNNIHEDTDGSLWVCEWQQGIYHITLDEACLRATEVELFNKDNGLYVDQGNTLAVLDDVVYISSVDGFYTYNRKTHKLKKEDALTDMFHTGGVALQLHKTGNGDIWGFKQGFLAMAHHPVSGNQFGDYHIDSTSFQSIANELQIWLGKITNLNATYTLFNSHDGFYLINGNYQNTTDKSNVYIRGIVSINTQDTLMYTSNLNNDATVKAIPHHCNSLRLEFVMPEYRSANNVMYSCYLENYDKTWTAEQKACYKEYTHLAKGHYRFHVRARNLINGSQKETVIEFTIKAAWYETYWAYALYVILISLLLYGIYLFVEKKNAEKMERIQEKQRQQTIELKSQNLESALHHKSNELASSTMNLVHKNDILQKLDGLMGKLSESVRREEPKREITTKINEIRKSIQESLNDDNNWDKFEESFDIIYHNFMARLSEQYPELKESDRKLCAYLRMGLSSKEIAPLFNTTTRSVETARYRLRKKLSLAPGDNLVDFLQNF